MRNQEQETPPGRSPAARCRRERVGSGFHSVAALPVFALCGGDGQAHFLPHGSRKEPAQRVRLIGSRFKQFLGGSSARSLQQGQDRGGFAALPGVVSRASGRFLFRGGLLTRLTLGGRDVRASCVSTGLFRGLRLGRRFRLFCSRVVSLGADYRVTRSITPKAPESKPNQSWRTFGDAAPLIARWVQMGADGGWAWH
jgi:hypothetical protein